MTWEEWAQQNTGYGAIRARRGGPDGAPKGPVIAPAPGCLTCTSSRATASAAGTFLTWIWTSEHHEGDLRARAVE